MKYLNELTHDELKAVYEKNSKLQQKVLDDMLDSANVWNGEYLACWKGGIDYCLGCDRGTYFKCTDRDYFIAGLEKAQNDYCFLPDEWDTKIEYVAHLIDRLNNLAYADEVNEERLNKRIDELISELETACYKRFMEEYGYCFDSKNQLDYFLEFYAAERMDNDFYIDDEYVLRRRVVYTESYA